MDQTFALLLIVLLLQQQLSVTSETQVQKRSTHLPPDRKKVAPIVVGAFVVGALFGGALTCAFVCQDSPDPPKPPTIDCSSPTSSIYYPGEGETTKVVTWKTPTSPDGDVKLVSGKASGSTFPQGSYSTVYVAVNSDGYTSLPCAVQFLVEVKKCTRPFAPNNGRVTCEINPPSYGDSCEFQCFDGYVGTGSSSIKCGSDGSFGGDSFACLKASCGEPEIPLNSVSTCTNGDVYTSLCSFPCQEGYDRDDGIVSITCQADGTWNPPKASDCRDVLQPSVHNCPASFVAYVGADQMHALIDYIPPTANDTLDGEVQVILVEGPAPGDTLAINRDNVNANQHTVTYTAVDSGGREAITPCTFTVIVADLICPPLENQPKLNTSCTEPLYVYGSSCDFSCFSGYPLEGVGSVICEKYEDRDEAYWNWGEGNGPTKCTVKDCPDLDPPLNGAIGCVPLSLGKQCVMFCNEKFDVPVSTDGIYVCDHAVGWVMGDDEVPDCTVERSPFIYFLPIQFTYAGDCSSAETLDTIRDLVINITLGSDYSSFCKTECTAENVNVTCGELNISDQYANLDMQVNSMYNIFLDGMVSGLFDIPALNLHADPATLAQGWADLDCQQKGLTMDYSTLKCKACPTGTKYDTISKSCTACPIGSYQDQDAQYSCIPCPEGFSTASKGSRHFDNCIERCPPGSVSTYGIMPCYPCDVGTYQPEMGQMMCIACPNGTNSTIQGSSSLLNCKSDNIACVDAVCGTHGVCVPDLDTDANFTCVCRDGYSGTDCSVPPSTCYKHACQYNSTCVPLENNYTCTCQTGYTGQYCQGEIVDGGWSAFGNWSDCSKTCGTGSQIRYRSCDIPYPQNGGLDCEGDQVEEIKCATHPCPACPSPQRPYGGSVEVVESETDDTKTAILTCHIGKVLSDTTLSNFTCGEATGHIWFPIVERQNYPKCTELKLPENVIIESEIIYVVSEVPENMHSITFETENLLSKSPCVKSGDCRLNVSGSVVSSIEKRSIGGTIKVHVTLAASFHYDPYFVEGKFQEETVNASLSEYVKTISEMESLMIEFENATKNGDLQIEIDGEPHYPEDSFSASGYLGCPSGMESDNILCVNCPPGRREIDGRCVPCEHGTYQDQEGRINCFSCPEGQITKYPGADNIELCFTIATTSVLTAGVPEITLTTAVRLGDNPRQEGGTTEPTESDWVNNLMYLAIPGLLIPVVMIAVMYYCLHKKQKVNPQPENSDKEDTEGKYVDEYFNSGSTKNLVEHSLNDGNMILSKPPNYHARPTTSSDIYFD